MKEMRTLGKETDWQTRKEKEFTLRSKLTDKDLQVLEKGEKVDAQLGLCTPSMMLEPSASEIKLELPSLHKLKESDKTAKSS